MKNWFLNIFSLVATGFCYLVGGIDYTLIALLIIMALDYITGVISAIYNKELSSRIGAKGILKKVLMLCIIGLSVIVDRLTGETGAVRTLVIYYYVANEGISILENLVECDVPFPDKVLEVLKQLQNKDN